MARIGVSMDPHVRYRSSSVGRTPFTGELTDARIRYWARQGYYGSEAERIALQEKVKKNYRVAVVCQATKLANKYINI